MAKNKNYQEWLLEKLKDHDESVAYLNAALEERLKDDEESQQLFLVALRNVAEAQGGVGTLAKKLEYEEKVYTKHFPISDF